MAALSAQSSPHVVSAMSDPSPQLKGLKKVLSNRRRSSEVQSESIITGRRTDSLDSINLDKSLTRASTRSSPSRDGSSKSGGSSVRKLLPGHSKRKRRKILEEELKATGEEVDRGRQFTVSSPPTPLSRGTSSNTHDGDHSLLTDDSEIET